MQYLRQSTASQSVLIGPFVDSTNGNDAETGLTVANTDIRLSKNGANIVAKNSGGGTHDELGYYAITLDATDTDTVGRLQLAAHVSGALPVYHEYQVLEEAVYDALFEASANAFSGAAGSTTLTALAAGSITAAVVANGAIDAATFAADVDAEILSYLVDDATRIDASALNTAAVTTVPAILTDTAEIGAAGAGLTEAGGTGDHLTAVPWNAAWDAEVQSEAADALNAYDPPTRAELTSDINSVLAYLDGLVIAKGTIGATGNTTTTLHLDGLTYGDDEINNYLLAVKDVSAGEWHARYVEDWADAGDLVTVATLPFTPEASVDLYVLLAFRQDVTGGSGLDAAGVRAAVGLASANLDTQLGTIDSNVDAILVDTGTTLQGELDGIQADTEDIQSRLPAALGANGGIKADLRDVLGAAVTEGAAGRLAAGFVQWFNVASPTGNLNSLPSAAAGASGGGVPVLTGGALDYTVTAVGSVFNSVGSVAAGGITSSSFAAGAITAAACADGFIDRASFAADTGLQSIRSGTAQAGASASITLDAGASSSNDFYNGCLVKLTGGTGVGQVRRVIDYTGSTKIVTLDRNWATSPDSSTTFAVLDNAGANVTHWAGEVQVTSGGLALVVAQSVGNTVNANVTQISGDSTAADNAEAFFDGTGYAGTGNTIPTVTTLTNLPAITANWLTAAGLAADAVAEIQSGLSTLDAAGVRSAVGLASANLDTQLGAIDDFLDTEVAAVLAAVDTEVAAIKAKTDSLTFTVAANLDVNCQYVNDVQVIGVGTSGSPWRPA